MYWSSSVLLDPASIFASNYYRKISYIARKTQRMRFERIEETDKKERQQSYTAAIQYTDRCWRQHGRYWLSQPEPSPIHPTACALSTTIWASLKTLLRQNMLETTLIDHNRPLCVFLVGFRVVLAAKHHFLLFITPIFSASTQNSDAIFSYRKPLRAEYKDRLVLVLTYKRSLYFCPKRHKQVISYSWALYCAIVPNMSRKHRGSFQVNGRRTTIVVSSTSRPNRLWDWPGSLTQHRWIKIASTFQLNLLVMYPSMGFGALIVRRVLVHLLAFLEISFWVLLLIMQLLRCSGIQLLN